MFPETAVLIIEFNYYLVYHPYLFNINIGFPVFLICMTLIISFGLCANHKFIRPLTRRHFMNSVVIFYLQDPNGGYGGGPGQARKSSILCQDHVVIVDIFSR